MQTKKRKHYALCLQNKEREDILKYMKIISYNIHLADRLEVIIREFQARGIMEDTAILCLQEVLQDENGNTCEKILAAFPHLSLQYRLEPFPSQTGKIQANAIIYRSDILRCQKLFVNKFS
jgi:hypothetical protein